MTLSDKRKNELLDLIDALCYGTITPEQSELLQQRLLHDREAQWFYLQRLHLHGSLLWNRRSHTEWAALQRLGECADVAATGGSTREQPAPSRVPPAVPLGGTWRAASNYLAGHEIFTSYLMATIFLAIALVIGQNVYVAGPQRQNVALNDPSPAEPEIVFVGRITGMADCRWNNPGREAFFNGASVPLGRKYTLASGLVQITYDSGAKVILEGPCTYKVESARGGYLALGKLTARVEKNAEEREGREEEAVNPKSPNPFFVSTPVAVVTDLGTEFAVEVGRDGTSDIQVFQGKITIAVETTAAKKTLAAGEAVQVKREADGNVRFLACPGEVAGVSAGFDRLLPRVDPRAYAKTVLADEPLFYWTFDEYTGPAFEQVRHLAHQALVPRGGAGRYRHSANDSGLALGRAADFTWGAGAFVSRVLSQGRTMPGAWAIEFWIQPGEEDARQAGQYVLHAGLDAEPAEFAYTNPAVIFNWAQGAAENELQLYRHKYGPTHGGPMLEDRRWRHVIFTFYGNGDKFGVTDRVDVVVDGQRRTIDRGRFTAGFGIDGRLWLGAHGEGLNHAFRGRIDELAFYDLSDMTEQEIEQRISDIGRRHFEAARPQPRISNPTPKNIERKGGGR